MKISVNRDERLPTHRVKITREFSSQRCDLAYIAATILNYKVGHLPSNLCPNSDSISKFLTTYQQL